MSEANMESLARRLERVERENRRLRRGAVAVVGVIVAAILMGQGGSKGRIIEAEGFHLMDAAGARRGGLFTSPDGAVGLALYGKDGKALAMLAVEADTSPSLWFTDKDGNTRVRLGIGSKENNAPFNLGAPGGKASVALFAKPDGTASLNLFDKEGKERATLGHTALEMLRTGAVEQTAASSLVLFDKEGKVLWKAP